MAATPRDDFSDYFGTTDEDQVLISTTNLDVFDTLNPIVNTIHEEGLYPATAENKEKAMIGVMYVMAKQLRLLTYKVHRLEQMAHTHDSDLRM